MADQKREKVILDDKVMLLFEGNMKRIFAMKITRSTFRELQNVILNCANQDQSTANFLFESLMTGQVKESLTNEKHREILEDVIRLFTIPARLAKEVFERGEFINIITSDLVTGGEEQYAFINRLRRIDGEEFIFMSDPQNTIHIIQHFIGRLHELKKAEKGGEQLEKHRDELTFLRERLKQLVG